jgi:RimJ/RimL family protein N-acetyltransferase
MSWFKTLVKLIGIRTGRFRTRMEESGLALRLYRLGDLTALRSPCKTEVLSAGSGVRLKAFSSLVSSWRWMHRTFQISYVIEVHENDFHRIIGFLGIYNMELGREFWVSLVLFDERDRGREYGQRALQLLMTSLQEDRIVKRVCGEILAGNTGSLRLLEKLGFDVFAQAHGRFLLRKQLGHTTKTAHS